MTTASGDAVADKSHNEVMGRYFAEAWSEFSVIGKVGFVFQAALVGITVMIPASVGKKLGLRGPTIRGIKRINERVFQLEYTAGMGTSNCVIVIGASLVFLFLTKIGSDDGQEDR
jgi:hypothetical protein